ncbi:MAG TPA: alpha-amylase family glycosyl hydrolase, partial [Bryobacteraceae bacterium]|nr:alpha-amylase family glycosyl hydrolase [Bryobacteraceae bacterium]
MKHALVCLAAVLCHAASPVVTRVEPPNWPAASRPTTLRLLLTGENLSGARVSGCNAGEVRDGASAHYLFVDVTVASAGECTLQLTTAGGTTSARFNVVAALPPEQRFQGFSPDDVIYLIMPDRFADGDPSNDDPAVSHGLFDRGKPRYYHGGDLAGIEQHLPYLRDLGVTALWLTPVYDNTNRLNERERDNGKPVTDYHGYGAVDFYAVDEHLGTLDSLRRLVDTAHGLGLKVIQDNVCNHTGPYHPWVMQPPTATWYHGTEASHINETWQ